MITSCDHRSFVSSTAFILILLLMPGIQYNASSDTKFCSSETMEANMIDLTKAEREWLKDFRKNSICQMITEGLSEDAGILYYSHLTIYLTICDEGILDQEYSSKNNLTINAIKAHSEFCKKSVENPLDISHNYNRMINQLFADDFCDFAIYLNDPGGWFGLTQRMSSSFKSNERYFKYLKSVALDLCTQVEDGEMTSAEAFAKYKEIGKREFLPTLIETILEIIKKGSKFTIKMIGTFIKWFGLLIGAIGTLVGIAVGIRKLYGEDNN